MADKSFLLGLFIYTDLCNEHLINDSYRWQSHLVGIPHTPGVADHVAQRYDGARNTWTYGISSKFPNLYLIFLIRSIHIFIYNAQNLDN